MSPRPESRAPEAAKPARVALVRPPVVSLPKSLSSYGATPPLGLGYIAAVVREAGHDLQVLDAPGEAFDVWRSFEGPVGTLEMHGLSPSELVDALRPGTEVIGVTHMFLHEWPVVRAFCEGARARFPDATLVLGGENATAFWSWLFELSDAFDCVVLGEGEETMVALLAALQAGEPFEGLPGLAWRTPEGSATSGLPPRIRAPEAIPYPAWDLLPIERYLGSGDNHGVHRGRTLPLLATRGCPFQCTFCSSPGMWTTRYVMRDPEDVVAEISHWVHEFGLQNVNFADLTAVTKKSWILGFCEALIAADLGVTWQLPTGTRSEVLDAEVLDALYRSGCRNVTYNPESGSKSLLETMKKRVSLEPLLDSLRAADKVGLMTRTCFIVGHPAERRRDVLDTARLIVQAALTGSQDTSVVVFGPYPGSEDFHALIEQGRLQVDERYLYLALVRSGASLQTFHPTRSRGEIVATQMSLLLLFYGVAYARRPQRFADRLRALVTGTETSPVDQLLRFKLRQLRTKRETLRATARRAPG